MDRFATIAGPVVFIAAIAAHWLFGVHAMVRIVGIGCVVGGIHSIVTRQVPVGIEGRPPSFHLRGVAAVISGAALLAVGLGMLFFAPVAACMLGWASEC